MQKALVQQLESVVDEEKKISHEQLASDTEDAFGEPLKLGVKVRPRERHQRHTRARRAARPLCVPGRHGLLPRRPDAPTPRRPDAPA
eukprot:1318787-Prymnesium_polylepis.1